jgi:uncharacterized protein (DUF433 family)
VRELITVRSDVYFGKPCVEGTRIIAKRVLELMPEGLASVEVCHGSYPDLSMGDARAYVQHAIDLIGVDAIRLAKPA